MNKRESFLWVCVPLLLLAVRYALAQENVDGVGWDFEDYDAYGDPAELISGLMICAPILGAFFGAVRVITSRCVRPVLEPIRLN